MPDYPITVNDRFFSATAVAAQTVFTPDFPLLTAAEVEVKRIRAGVATILTLTTHYAITGLNQEAGFTCTLTAGALVNDVYEFRGLTKPERLSDYPAGQALQTAALNGDLDRATLRAQEALRDLANALFQASGPAPNGARRLPAPEASKVLGWNDLGTELRNYPFPSGAGTGDVVGPNVSGNLRLPIFDGVSGKILADSGVTLADLLPLSQKGAANGLASLDGLGKLLTTQLPPLSITSVTQVASQAAQLALVREEGDVVIRTDESRAYIHNGGVSGTMADYNELGLGAYLLLTGGTMTGPLITKAADAGAAYFRLPNGVDPAGLVNGDMWSTAAAFKVRIGGVTRAIAFQDQLVSGSVLRGYIDGLRVSTDGANTVTVTAGMATSDDGTYSMVLPAQIAKLISANWVVGNNNGGLDTGAEAASTWYHVWLIARSDTGVVDILLSRQNPADLPNMTAPTMPANYDKKRRILSVRNNSGSNLLLLRHVGDEVLLDTEIGDADAQNPGAAAVIRTLTVPTGVQVQALISGGIYQGTTAGGLAAIFSALDKADQAPQAPATAALTGFSTISGNFGAVWHFVPCLIRTNTSAQIRSRLSASGANDRIGIITRGWIDPRGQDA